MLPWDHWQERWNAALKACIGLGGEIDKLVISEPADDEEIESIEAKLGFRLPLSFREVLLGFSAQVECYWSLPDSLVPPKPLDQIFAGDCSWDLHRILTMQESYHERVKTAFPNTDDPYHKLWHNKLVFIEIDNGDRLALDLDSPSQSPVIYLSFFEGRGHGYQLGEDFADFMNRWTLLGCPGPEDKQLLPFTNSPLSGLQPQNENAKRWKEWFGLSY